MIARLLEEGWRGVGAVGDWQPVAMLLENLYRQHWRFYHNAEHIEHCAVEFDRVRQWCEDEPRAALAIVFHDAVYVAGASDNEEQSALLATSLLRAHRVSDLVSQSVATCIRATSHKEKPPEGSDSAFVVDIDLSILGAPPDVFGQYEVDIRKEYAFVDEPEFQKGRAKILRSFLDRGRIYSTEFFRDCYESQARENLERSLARLTCG